jgi:predicted metal-binding protein
LGSPIANETKRGDWAYSLGDLIMKRVILAASLICSVCQADDRVSVAIPSEEERQVQDLLERLKEAVNSEDAQAYLACLTKSLAAKQKQDVVVRFMAHDMEMEIEQCEVLESGDSVVEFIAKYTLYQDGQPTRIISSVKAKRDGDILRVSKEDVLSRAGKNNRLSTPMARNVQAQDLAANPCANGRCPLPRNQVAEEAEFPKGVSLFNDEHGNPDPNGIMWLPPGYLFRKFPEKYGVPQCVRARFAAEAKEQSDP